MKKFLIFISTLISFTYLSAQRQYPQWVPPSDLGLQERILREKQQAYNQNYNLVYDYIDELMLTVQNKATEYSKAGKTFSDSQIQSSKNIDATIATILRSDLSSNLYARQVISYLKSTINTVKNW